MTLGEIILAVQRQFGDTSEAEITPTDITRWANEAQLDIVRKTETLQKKVELSIVATQNSYVLPTNIIDVRRVTVDGKLITRTTLEEMDKYLSNRESETQSGEPSKYWLWGDTLYLYPAPTTAGTNNLDILYVKIPATLTVSGDIPEIPLWMHEDIIRYCLAKAKELDEEDNKSQQLMREYEERVGFSRHEAQHRHLDSYPSVRVLPGDDGYTDGWY